MGANGNIPKFEIIFYLVIWISSIIYAIYQTYSIGSEYFSVNLYDTFTDGWSWLHRRKDDSDYEWKFGLKVLITLMPWYILHVVGAEISKYFWSNKSLPYWHCTLGLVFSLLHLGRTATVYFLFQPLLGYLVVQFNRKSVIWIYNLFALVLLNYYDYFNIDISHYNDYKMHVIVSTIAWINLRCINYFLEAVEDKNMRKINFKNILTVCGYCFYLPFMFLGPLVIFTNFKSVFDQSGERALFSRLQELITSLARFSFWLLFTEFGLHFVYVNAISYDVELIKSMNDWALYGLGYCMGQIFHLKYVVFYGLGISLAKFDGVTTPNIPKCIGRIHLYSDMWKYFDQGLYAFLLKYIYIPACGAKRTLPGKILGSCLCFLYVYVWHGVQSFIAIWAMLNFLGIIIETLCHEMMKLSVVNKTIDSISAAARQRVLCAAVTPLFAMSALSNFYFFAGKEVGDIYIRRFLNSPSWVLFIIFSVLYCGSHIAVEIKRWERSKDKSEHVL